jgi:acyl-CoA thioester hydrolase
VIPEPPSDRDVFELALTPVAADIDDNGHVNNVVYLRWVQDVATDHWRSRVSDEAAARWAWVVARHEIDYRKPLHLGETATARTWVGTPQGARFDRHVLIEGPEGVCARARSEWVLLDAATRRPVRIRDEVLRPFLR